MKPTIPPDPPIDEIREIRHQISAKFDHDPAKLVAYLMEYQQQFRDRLVYDPSIEPTDPILIDSGKEFVREPVAPGQLREHQ